MVVSVEEVYTAAMEALEPTFQDWEKKIDERLMEPRDYRQKVTLDRGLTIVTQELEDPVVDILIAWVEKHYESFSPEITKRKGEVSISMRIPIPEGK